MKKLLVLTTTYPRWADDSDPAFVHNLNKQLTQGFEVHVLAPHAPGARTEELLDGVFVHRYRYFPTRWQKLAYDGGIMPNIKANRWLVAQVPFLFVAMLWHGVLLNRKYRFALLHAHWLLPQGLIALWIKKLAGQRQRIKVLVTSHGSDLHSLTAPFFVNLKRYVLRYADGVTVVSSAMQQYCRDRLDNQHLPRVLPMGIDCQQTFACRRAIEDRRGLLFVGRLIDGKGVDVLLRAYAVFADRYPDVNLTIVGDGPLRQQLAETVRQCRLEDRVLFAGALDSAAVADCMNNASVLIVPSLQEGLGIVIGEALACGCVVLSSALPAIQDIHNDAGLQFAVGDSEALLQRLVYVFDHPDDARVRAARLRRRVIEKFDWPEVGKAYADLLDSL